jgi:hypothetical protein
VCFKHLFLVNVELNKSMLYVANFGSSFIMDLIRWAFLLGLLVRWLSGLSKTSLFLMFDIVNNRHNIFNATDNNNRDDAADKKSVNNQEDTVDAMEDNGDNSETNETLPLDGFHFFVGLFDPDLPFFFSVADIFLWGRLVILHHGFSNE